MILVFCDESRTAGSQRIQRAKGVMLERGLRVTRREHELVAREFIAFEIETRLSFIYLGEAYQQRNER